MDSRGVALLLVAVGGVYGQAASRPGTSAGATRQRPGVFVSTARPVYSEMLVRAQARGIE